jgi:hypothetical protein
MSKYIGTKAVNLSTTSADVTGNADIDGNLTVGGDLTVSGTTITVDHATAQTVDLGDNDKIRLGADYELQLWSDGTTGQISGDINHTGSITTDGLTVDTDTLHVDATNNRVGVGTSSPAAPLEVSTSSADYRIQLTHTSGQNKIKSVDGDQSTFRNLMYDAVAHFFEISGSEAMRIDSSRNVSIGGFAPETWSLGKALHIGSAENALWGEGDYAFHMMQNAYYNSGWKYVHSDEANRFALEDGKFIWATAATGTADAALTFSERMRLDNDGFLGIGTSTPRQLLHVNQQTSTSDAIIRISNSNTPAAGGAHRVEFADGTGTTEGSTVFRYAYIAGERSGASNDGHFIVGTKPNNAGSPTERMRIDSSGNLLVGKTSSGSSVRGSELRDGTSGFVATFKSDGDGINIDRSTSGAAINFRQAGANCGEIGPHGGGDLYMGQGGAALQFYSAASSIIPYSANSLSANDAGVNLGHSSFRWNNLYLSGGVYIGGTGAANKLDDYEEGTWTPALQSGDGCFTSVTSISNASGFYTKVGNQVTAWYKFSVDQSITNAEGILRIDGLPFTSSFTNYGSGGAQLYLSHGSNNSEVASAGISNTTLYVYRGTVNGTTGTPQIQGFATYQTGS